MRGALILMISLVLLSPARADDQIALVENGEVHCSIVVPEDAPDVTRFAADELAKYLTLLSGVDVPIVAQKSANTLVIEIQPRPWRDEAFDVIRDGNGITIKAGERAILPAVYHVLEDLGCRFLAPQFEFYDGSAEVIGQTRALQFSPHEPVTTKPRFAFRKLYVEEGLSHTEERLRQLIDWMPKGGYNTLVIPMDYQWRGRVMWDNWRAALTPELQKRRIIIEVGGHGYQNFIGAKMMENGEPLFDQHPEWFALDDKGQRRQAEKYVFCTSNEEAFAYFQNNVEDYVRKRPEIEIFDLWPPDGAVWCECEPCKAIGEPQDRQALLMNRMQNAFRTFNGPRLEMIAYSRALLPPSGQTLDPTIMVDFCPINQQFEYQIDDPASSRNKEYADALRSWRELFTGDLCLYSYYRKYAWRSLPAVMPHYLQKDLQWFASLPLQGISVYSEPADWGTYELNHYVLGKLAWDPEADVDQIVRQFCQARYPGHADLAATTLIELGNIARTTAAIRFTELKAPEAIAAARSRLEEMLHTVQRAQTGSESMPAEAQALNRLELMIGFAFRDLAVQHAKASGQPSEVVLAAVKEEADYFAAHAGHGVFETGEKEQLPRFMRLHGLATTQPAENATP